MSLYELRLAFFGVCEQHNLTPAHVCVQFSFLFADQIQSVALNAGRLEHVAMNFKNTFESIAIAHGVWKDLKRLKLIDIEIED